MKKIIMKNKTNIIVLTIALLLSSCTVNNNNSVKNITKCHGDVLCHHLKYKFNGNIFMYKYTLISGYKNIKYAKKELYKKTIKDKNFRVNEKIYDYYLNPMDIDGLIKLLDILKEKQTAEIYFEDEDEFKLLSINTKACWNNSKTFLSKDKSTNNIYGYECQHSYEVSPERKRKIKNIRLYGNIALIENFDLYINKKK